MDLIKSYALAILVLTLVFVLAFSLGLAVSS